MNNRFSDSVDRFDKATQSWRQRCHDLELELATKTRQIQTLQAQLNPVEGALQTLIQATANPIAVYRQRDRQLVAVSPSFAHALGYTCAELVGQSLDHPTLSSHPEQLDSIQQHLQTGSAMPPFELTLRPKLGSVSPLLVSAQVLHWLQEPGILIAVIPPPKLASEPDTQSDQTAQLIKHGQVLDQLTLDLLLSPGSLGEHLNRIATRSQAALNTDRAGIWLAADDQAVVWNCQAFVQSAPPADRGTAEIDLPIANYPVYLEALHTEQVLAITDACTDPRVAEFQADYTSPRNIAAMLEVPIRWQGHTIGVICHEQVGTQRAWSVADVSFARSIGNLVTLAIAQQHQVETERMLRDREERWQLATAGTRDAIWDVNLITQTTYKSRRWYEMLGYHPADVPAHDSFWAGIIHPDDRDRVLSLEAAYLRREIPLLEQEYRLRCADGSYRWIRSRSQAVWDDQGRAIRLVGANTDITQQKQSEAALKLIVQGTASSTGHEFFQCLVKCLAEAIDFQYAMVAKRTENPVQAEVLAFWSTHHGFGSTFVYNLRGAPCERVVEDQAICCYPQNVRALFPEDEYLQQLPVDGYWGAPLLNAEGEVIGIMAVLSETEIVYDQALESILQIFAARAGAELERAQAEAKLLETSDQLREAQRLARLGRWGMTLDQQQVDSSPEFISVWGFDAEQPPQVYDDLLQAVHPDDQAEFATQIQTAIAQPHPVYFDHRVIAANGTERYLSCCLQWMPTTLHQPPQIVGTSLDITERKRAEMLSEQARQAADAANQAKSDFLANMSHELRTPLTAILGLSEVLQEEIFGALNERQHTYLATIAESGHHLLDLINDLLDLAKIEAGRLDLQREAIQIPALCKSSLNFIQEQAHRKRIQLHLDVPPGLPQLWADHRRLRQVLINLLSNAVKFTPEAGSITLAAQCDRDRTAMQFSVTDTGIGIPADQITYLFEPFTQLDSSFTREYKGTGLGLALVKQVVELHNGSIAVTSEPHQGSCFTVTIPGLMALTPTEASPRFAIADEPPVTTPWSVQTGPLILLVEDSDAIVLTVQDYLQKHHCRVEVARNGWEAIQMTQHLQPDLVIMDTQMPKLDGIEATYHIRHTICCQHIPIIALSSLVMPGDRDRCLAAGATLYLTKPLHLQQLLQAIVEQLAPAAPALSTPTPLTDS